MKNLVKAILGGSRVRKALVRTLALVVVFATTYSLVLPAITKTADLAGELDGVSVRVETDGRAVPVDATMALKRVLLPGDPEADESTALRRLTDDEVERIRTAALDGDESMDAEILRVLDIALEYNGNEIEPSSAVRLVLQSELIREAVRPAIVHLDDNGDATLLAVLSEDGEVAIQLGEDEVQPEPGESVQEPAQSVEPEESALPETPDAEESVEPAQGADEEESSLPAENAGEQESVEPEQADGEENTDEPEQSLEPSDAPEEQEPAPFENPDPVENTSGEITAMTDGFSVYAIVDLSPKTEQPETPEVSSEGGEIEEPAETIKFAGNVEDMDVFVTAPITAFPEGTTMQVTMVPVEEVEAEVNEAVAGEVQVVKAVDITFYNAEGEEIEPSEPISVVMKPHEQIAEIANAENDAQLVHIGKEETTVMTDAAVGADEVSFESGEFSTYVIVIPLGKPGIHTYSGEGVTITVTYGPEANLPEGTSLVVRELEEGTDEYDEYFAKTESALNLDASVISMEDVSLEAQLAALMGGEQKVEKARFFDITLEHNGGKVEPAAPVDVEIKYDDAEEAEGVQIVHFAEEEDGTERPEIITPTVEDGTVTYQQESFSITATAMASQYGNGGWWYTKAFNANTPTYRMRFRYHNGIFELGYPGNYYVAGTKDNADWSWPGDPGYPTFVDGKLNEGTTIEEILKALATCGDPTYCNTVTGVDFMMYGTYTVDNSNWEANGSRNTGAQETEVWTGNFYGTWGTPKGTWKQKSIGINRMDNFSGPLIHIESSGAHPVHARDNVVINNSGSGDVAVLIENKALLMMEVNSYIIGGPNKAGAVGTGVYLNKGGSVEFFDNSFVTNMNVAVEQKNGKTRLKTSPNPFGENNGRAGMNDGNTTGVALWPGQSIGKWTEALPGNMQPVPIQLVNLDQWKSGDIVMDSGRWWYNEKYTSSGRHDEMYGAVVESDLRKDKFYFQNPQDGVNMALEYYSGGKTYTSSTVTNKGGNNQLVAPGEKYPVIRFTVGTVYNTRTNTWYRTLYDAVNNENNMGPGNEESKALKSNDTLIFYGSTVEDRVVTIPGTVQNLTIRTSNKEEMANDNRSGSACTADINAGIVISEGASVTFQSGDAGDLTLTDAGSSTIITNNGTLNLKSGVTLTNAGVAGVYQDGEFHLYEGAEFKDNKAGDVTLTDKHYITLETVNPNEGAVTKVQLADEQYDGRDVVVPGETDDMENKLDDSYLGKFPLTNLDNEEFEYIYNQTGSPTNGRVLELKRRDSIHIRILKVDGEGNPLSGAEFTVYGEDGKEYALRGESNPHATDAAGVAEFSVRDGSFTLKETKVPAGYTGSNNFSFTVKKVDGKLTLSGDGFDAVSGKEDTYEITVENTPKTVPVTLVKVDAQGNALSGVTFTLNDGEGKATDNNGVIDLGGFTYGKTYTLAETWLTDQYQTLSGPISLTVGATSEGKLTLTASGAEADVKNVNITGDEAGFTVTVTNNPSKVKVQLYKTDGGTKALTGAAFELREGESVIYSGTSDTEGYVEVWQIDVGKTYTLTETVAPAGYRAMAGDTTIRVNTDGTVTFNGGETSSLEAAMKNDAGVIVITVPNNPGAELPHTGGMGTTVYTFTGIALMIGAALLMIEVKKKGRERA